MTQIRVYARNLFASWAGYATNLLVVFFLSPFIVHSLGDVQYGVWSLMVSLTGYLGLIEAGTQAGLGRFINFYLGRKELGKVSGVASTGMAIFLAMGVVLAVVACLLAMLMPSIFSKIPADLMGEARILCLLVALNLWLSLLAAPFRLIIQSKERFELINAIDVLVLLGRAAGTLVVLMLGRGLAELAYIQIASSVFGLFAAYVAAQRVMPKLSISAKQVSVAQLRELFGFSSWAFLGAISYRLLVSTDAVLIGVIFGPKWVTIYAIGDLLVQKSRDVVNHALNVFRPRIMQTCGKGNMADVREQYVSSMSLAMGVAILVMVGLVVFGDSFIGQWMGDEYHESYPILVILASSCLLALSYSAALPVYAGLNRIRVTAIIGLCQAGVNLVLSPLMTLWFGMGLEGIAWATFIPRVLFSTAGTLLAIRLMGLPFRSIAGLISRWAIVAIGFGLICLTIDIMFGSSAGWSVFLAKVSLATLAYIPLAWLFLLESASREWLKLKLSPILPSVATRRESH
ncbi:MAG: oligosaccharide flippase family protein [Planctomycetota bacterium]